MLAISFDRYLLIWGPLVAVVFTARVPVLNNDGRVIGLVAWDQLGEEAEVGDVRVPAKFHLRFHGSSEQPSLQITFGIHDGAPVCTGVVIESKPEGVGVRPSDFDIIRRELANWSEAAITAVMRKPADDEIERLTHAPDFVDPAVARRAYQQARKRARRKVDDRLLGEVAALYREYFDDRPWRVIAERFNVSETTAARYVVLARKAGLLPATEPGKKKA